MTSPISFLVRRRLTTSKGTLWLWGRHSPISMRSEERRVGKEWIYQCDWSSDVCSSDLIDLIDDVADFLLGEEAVDDVEGDLVALGQALADQHEIGRAAGRERVDISV